MARSMIKAIETAYKGYRFRSRLEARWAVFFDALGIDWEYEHEGFELSNGSRYLPDFWLPTFDNGMWCEVKPEGGDFSKAKLFAEDYGEQIWFCEGTPQLAVYKYCCPGFLEHGLGCGIPNWDQATDEDRMFVMPCQFSCNHCPNDGINHLSERPYKISEEEIYYYFYGINQEPDQILVAVNAARGARFEYGE